MQNKYVSKMSNTVTLVDINIKKVTNTDILSYIPSYLLSLLQKQSYTNIISVLKNYLPR